MKKTQVLSTLRVTAFEDELMELCSKKQAVSKQVAIRRAMVRGSYNVIGAMGIAQLRKKHGLTYGEMLEILETVPEGELPKAFPPEADEAREELDPADNDKF